MEYNKLIISFIIIVYRSKRIKLVNILINLLSFSILYIYKNYFLLFNNNFHIKISIGTYNKNLW